VPTNLYDVTIVTVHCILLRTCLQSEHVVCIFLGWLLSGAVSVQILEQESSNWAILTPGGTQNLRGYVQIYYGIRKIEEKILLHDKH
jgi:hypothetical protein